MLLELKKEVIYGPVNSRRLGRSLGLNILPAGRKVCPFNCVYCQYGWTQNPYLNPQFRKGFPAVKVILDGLQSALSRLSCPPEYITFSGNGEPTLHPDFERLVEGVNSLRDRLSPLSKTAVLSNSALVFKKEVRRALAGLDVRILKFECGLPEVLERYNQPHKEIRLEKIAEGLAQLKDVTIQTLFSSGMSGNCGQNNIKEWLEHLRDIKPVAVQLYTLDRAFPLPSLKPATKEELYRIQKLVHQKGITCHVY